MYVPVEYDLNPKKVPPIVLLPTILLSDRPVADRAILGANIRAPELVLCVARPFHPDPFLPATLEPGVLDVLNTLELTFPQRDAHMTSPPPFSTQRRRSLVFNLVRPGNSSVPYVLDILPAPDKPQQDPYEAS